MAYTSLPRSAALIAASALAFSVNAQDGAYDPAFGNVGRDWINVTSSTLDEGTKLIRLPNGNLFMAGLCQANTCAAWRTPSGSLAAGYGTSGTGSAWFSGFPGWLAAGQDPGPIDVAAFSDGRVVLTATYNVGHVAVLRADGTGLDTAVGNGAGYIAPPFPAERVRGRRSNRSSSSDTTRTRRQPSSSRAMTRRCIWTHRSATAARRRSDFPMKTRSRSG